MLFYIIFIKMLYLVKTPTIIKKLFQNLTWNMTPSQKVIYLTFDDGPTPEITHWVLSELDKYNAKATFFCIGKNIHKNPHIFNEILEKGHVIGNHTNNHLNAWKKQANTYLDNIKQAQEIIDDSSQSNKPKNLFRPPYGKLTFTTTKKLIKNNYKIIMWDVLSGDFDPNITKEQCLENVIDNTTKGSIVVFHDSVKAAQKLQFVLPKVLQHFSDQGFSFEVIE